MLLATLNLLPAAISRLWPAGIPLVFFALILACPLYDWFSRRSLNAAYVAGGVLSLALLFLSVPFGATPGWHAIAHWLMQSAAPRP